VALAIVIPTYNEALTIERIIVATSKLLPNSTIIVVDDSSPDKTADVVKRLQKKYRLLHLIIRPDQDGLGGAYELGFRYALDHKFELIAQMDADFSHSPNDLTRLAAAATNSDVVIGSRYIKGGRIIGWTLDRIILSRLSNFYAKFLLGSQLCDWTGGFTVWKADFLRKIPFEKLRYQGYFFQIALKYWALRLGARHTELPITFKDREFGESKLNMRMFGEAFFGTLRLRLDTSNQIADTGNKP
jgi:dolichol-phosphate mannosyltransferase